MLKVAHKCSGALRGKDRGVTKAPRAVVDNVTVVVAGFDPSSFTDGCENAQLGPIGETVQLQVTV